LQSPCNGTGQDRRMIDYKRLWQTRDGILAKMQVLAAFKRRQIAPGIHDAEEGVVRRNNLSETILTQRPSIPAGPQNQYHSARCWAILSSLGEKISMATWPQSHPCPLGFGRASLGMQDRFDTPNLLWRSTATCRTAKHRDSPSCSGFAAVVRLLILTEMLLRIRLHRHYPWVWRHAPRRGPRCTLPSKLKKFSRVRR